MPPLRVVYTADAVYFENEELSFDVEVEASACYLIGALLRSAPTSSASEITFTFPRTKPN